MKWGRRMFVFFSGLALVSFFLMTLLEEKQLWASLCIASFFGGLITGVLIATPKVKSELDNSPPRS